MPRNPIKTPKKLLETLDRMGASPEDRAAFLLHLIEQCMQGITDEKINPKVEIPIEVRTAYPAVALAASKELTRMYERLHDHVILQGSSEPLEVFVQRAPSIRG